MDFGGRLLWSQCFPMVLFRVLQRRLLEGKELVDSCFRRRSGFRPRRRFPAVPDDEAPSSATHLCTAAGVTRGGVRLCGERWRSASKVFSWAWSLYVLLDFFFPGLELIVGLVMGFVIFYDIYKILDGKKKYSFCWYSQKQKFHLYIESILPLKKLYVNIIS